MMRWPMRVLAALAALASASPSLDAATPPAQLRTFDGWTAACDNLKSCVAIATAQDDLFYVRIARAAGADAPPEVKLVLASQEPMKGAAPAFRLTAVTGAERVPLGPFPARAAPDDPSVLDAAIAPGAPSLAFIDAIRGATSLDYAVLAARGSLDLKGLAAALRFIDAAQGRQGTPTALVARGMTPVGQVPPPPAPPVVAAATPGSVAPLDKPVVTKALSDLAATVCDPEVVADKTQLEAWKVGSDQVLVALPCTQGAYNLASALYLEQPDGADPKPVALPRATSLDADQAPNVVVNFGFDPKTMELSSLDKGRGLGDCGVATTWLWDGRAFALLHAEGLDACPGALPDDWPSLYAAKRQ